MRDGESLSDRADDPGIVDHDAVPVGAVRGGGSASCGVDELLEVLAGNGLLGVDAARPPSGQGLE
jgi:hypothetical protein